MTGDSQDSDREICHACGELMRVEKVVERREGGDLQGFAWRCVNPACRLNQGDVRATDR